MGVDDVLDGIGNGAVGGLGLALVVGAALLLGKGGRPLAKGAVKGYLAVAERASGLFTECPEQFQDLYADGRAGLAAGSGRATRARRSADG
jgi:hypothetical protein